MERKSEEKSIGTAGEAGTRAGRRFVVGAWLVGLAVALGAGLMLSAGAASSRAPWLPGGSGHWEHGPGGHGFFDAADHREIAADHVRSIAGRLLRRLDATEEQKSRIQERLEAAVDALAPVVEEHRANRLSWLDLLSEPVLDREALEALRRSEIALADHGSQIVLSALGDAGDVLTPEQRDRLARRLRDRLPE